MLEFNIRNQEISRIDSFSPTEKSVDYLIAKFNFKTEDWNGATKRAIFRNVKSKLEKDTMIQDDSCVVPWEVLVGSSVIEVSVHGVIGTEEITTNVATYNLDRTLSGGSATQEPSPTVYEQILKEVQETKDIAQSVRDDADAGKFDGKDGKDGKDGENGTGEIDEEQLLKFAIKQTTDKAPFHHITDSANMKVVDFGMEGKTEQPTTSGKNLFDVSKIGNTTRINADVPISDEIYGKTVTLSANVVNTSGIVALRGFTSSEDVDGAELIVLKGTQGTGRISKTGTISTEYHHYAVRVYDHAEGRMTDIQLEPDSVATEYEPFTNGSSPNPEYQQEIVNTGVLNEETGRYEIGCCVGNKNLFDLEKTQDESNYDWGAKYPYFPVYVGKGNTVTFSCKLPTETNYSVILFDGVDGNVIKYVWHFSNDDARFRNNIITFASPNDYFYISVSSNNMFAWIDDFTNIQIEISDTSTEFVPHASQPFTLTSPVPITKWDKLVKRDGVWGWSVNSKSLRTNDANELNNLYYGWYENNICTISIYDKKTGVFGNSFCDCFRNVAKIVWDGRSNIYEYSDHDNPVVYAMYFVTECHSRGEWIAWIAEHPLTFVYETAEEQSFHPLPDEEQTLLNNLETYYGVTNVYNEQGCPMWLTYVADTKLYVDQKLLEIQQAMI